MALSQVDRELLKRCLAGSPRAWHDFVDRFLGLVVHVVRHSAASRSARLSEEDVEDAVSEVFTEILRDDLALLRRFRGEASLATYLTVVARRVVVRSLARRRTDPNLVDSADRVADTRAPVEERMMNRDEVERLLSALEGPEAEVVRLYHLEGESYREISRRVGVPENSIGPTLSRARQKMRETGAVFR